MTAAQARVAVLGAGPIGIVAALAGRRRGGDVDAYEQVPRVTAAVRAWVMFARSGRGR